MSSLYETTKNEMKLGYVRKGKRYVLYIGIGWSLREGREIQRLVDLILTSEKRGVDLPFEAVEELHRLPESIKERIGGQKLFDFGTGLGARLVALKKITDEEPMTKGIRQHYESSWKLLFSFCPKNLTVRELDREAVENFAEHLFNVRNFTDKTVHERFKSLRRSFNYAQTKGAILYNPFNDVRAGKDSGTPSEYVDPETVEKVLPFCLDDETRLALVFARFAGVRTPSEIRDLKWSDIEAERFHIRKGKTGSRAVPLFPRISEELAKYRNNKSEWVFPLEHASNYCRSYWNIRRAVEKAGEVHGFEVWSKLLNSLRASCITEYAHAGFHEVTLNAVFGNSEVVRKKHYVKVREQEYKAMIAQGKPKDAESVLSVLKELLPLLSKKDLLKLWQDARKSL